MSEAEAKRVELLQILSDVDSRSAGLESIGRDLIQTARLSREVAAPMRDIVNNLPNAWLEPRQLDRELTSWRTWQQMADRVQESSTMVNSLIAASSGAINTTVSVVIAASPVSLPPQIEAAKVTLFRVLERSPLADQVRASMIRLGLNSRSGNDRTALQLLDDANGALAVIDGGPGSVLIPLRESIDASITELIRRRPVQEKVTGWLGKVLSLGLHCGLGGLPAAHFDQLGNQVHQLMNQLSGFKQRNLSREGLNEWFLEGLTFLNALLSSIDESKLKT